MKILHVISSMDPKLGGVCQAVRTMVGGLAKEGIISTVVSLDPPDSIFVGGRDDFELHLLGPSVSRWRYSKRLLPWLIERLADFDAVILHGLWLYHGWALRLALRQTGLRIPCLAMPHGMLDPYFQKARSRRIKALRNIIYWALAEKFVVNSATGLLFTCEEEMLIARRTFGSYKPRSEWVVGLGVDSPPPNEPELAAAFAGRCKELKNRPYILFLSRIDPKKGVDILIHSYFDLRRRFSGKATAEEIFPALVIAGPNDSAYAIEMQNLAKSLEEQNPGASSHGPTVIFPGMLAGVEKYGAFYGCKAFALPSRQENFGIAVVEALACGKPVLISKRVNIWREITTAGGGLAAEDNREDFAVILQDALNWDRETMGKICAEATESYWQYFSVSAANKKMKDILKNCCRGMDDQ